MTNKKKSKNNDALPFVSICTPTFNRRPFIEYTIKCFQHQDYPRDKMEWIIIDDGSDPIEDLVSNIPQVKYFKYDTKMPLGKKRNIMHEKSCGDIIVYMDDDDYYPPERVSHAVNMLLGHPKALCAGASEIYIWFKHIQEMWQFGPYSPTHATAGTFAFKRELLHDHRYNDTAALAEEKEFLKNYTVPFVQLEPKKTILVFSHIQNTFDKKRLIEQGENRFQKKCNRTVDEFVKQPDMKEFYMNTIDTLLQEYSPGDPSNKPDVLKQISEIDEERKKMMQEAKSKQGKIVLNQNGENIELSNEQIVEIMQKQQAQLQHFSKLIQEKDAIINSNSSGKSLLIESNDEIIEVDFDKLVELFEKEKEKVKLLESNIIEKNNTINQLKANNNSNSNSNSNSNNVYELEQKIFQLNVENELLKNLFDRYFKSK